MVRPAAHLGRLWRCGRQLAEDRGGIAEPGCQLRERTHVGFERCARSDWMWRKLVMASQCVPSTVDSQANQLPPRPLERLGDCPSPQREGFPDVQLKPQD